MLCIHNVLGTIASSGRREGLRVVGSAHPGCDEGSPARLQAGSVGPTADVSRHEGMWLLERYFFKGY